MSRLQRHGLMFAATAVLLLAGALWLPFPDRWMRLSVASAWLFTALLCTALLLGPLRNLSRTQNNYLRRDIGIWAVFSGLVHFGAGNAVAMTGPYLQAFVREVPAFPGEAVRYQLFIWGSIAGLIIALLLLILLLLSNDQAIRWLGLSRWKRAQRSALVVLWLTLLHGVAFFLLEGRWWTLLLFVLMVFATAALRRHGKSAREFMSGV